ncbi:hypothetical protein E2C01_036381 [Portunus trituberculatus]|uniref:Uncharacterized protein n=1 Tax=Portunus trituberculatus TaxID=210409 RepID=A0A5B7F5M0_PORTR|nr:hypothetical protein [Portunus trituberculatus]
MCLASLPPHTAILGMAPQLPHRTAPENGMWQDRVGVLSLGTTRTSVNQTVMSVFLKQARQVCESELVCVCSQDTSHTQVAGSEQQ